MPVMATSVVPAAEATALAALDEAKRNIALAKMDGNIDALMEWRDRAAAIQHYARCRDDAKGIADDAAEVKIRAERALGQLDSELNPRGRPSDKNKVNTSVNFTDGLVAVRANTRAAWRKLGAVDEDTFDAAIAKARADENSAISTNLILKVSNGGSTQTRYGSGDEWYTPKWVFDSLGLVFSIDVAAPVDRTYCNVPAEQVFTEQEDGLAQDWHGTVWCNPPYSNATPWATRMIAHGDGLMLSHVPMNGQWCVDVWNNCDGVRFFQAMEFDRPDGSSYRPMYWLQMAAFGPVALDALSRLTPPPEVAENTRRVPSQLLSRAGG